MPSLYGTLAERAAQATPHLAQRSLTVDHTQAITLGVMAVYVVVIALLWNLPYVRWSLWPFKVSPFLICNVMADAHSTDAGHCLP